jgi:PAS domain S-box-containing protein
MNEPASPLPETGEVALRQSTERLRLAVSSANVGLWDWDLRTNELYFSPEWKKQIGYEEHEITNSIAEWRSRVHPDDLERALQTVEAFLAKPWPNYSLQFRFRHKDGSYRWILAQASVQRDAQGKPVRMLGSHIDITEPKRAEEALRVAEAKYRTLFEYAPDGILIADPQSNYLDANSSMCRMLGYAREELIGLHAVDIVVPEEIPHIAPALNEVNAGAQYHREWLFRRKDGSTFSAEVIATTMPDGNILAMVRDITERKRAAAALRASEEQLAGIIDSVDGIVWEANAETFQFTFVSPRAERLLGYPPAQWIAEKDFWVSRIHPDDRDEAVNYCVKSTREMRDHEFEYRMLTLDGRVVWLRDIVTVVVQDGRPVKLRGIMVDVTDRKRVEAELRDREHRLAESQRLAHIGSWLYESSGQAKWTDEMYRIFGTSRETYSPKPESFLRLIHPEDRAAVRDWMAAGFAGKKLGDLEFRRVLPDGKIRHIYARGELLRDAESHPIGMAGTAQDVTERKELEGHLLRTQRMEVIGTLASGIAHDLNNILAPILMGAGMVKSRITSPEDANLLSIMEQSAQRGADVIRQLLTFSRGAEGQRAVVQPRHLLKEIVDIVRETFPREIAIVDASASHLSPVLADATQMHQVLLNLCVNARDAMPAGGRLTIAAENVEVNAEQALANSPAKPGAFVMLSVADTGHGIPAEIVPRLFDPFFTTKEIGKGTGLGLSSVLGIARSHRGFVTVETEPGKGSVFKVYFPVAPVTEIKATVHSRGLLPAGDGELVLLVDDEAAVRETTKLILEQYNYRVVTAANGEEAMGVFLEHRRHVQVVITDLMMPVMGGVALLRGLRALAPDLKLIATTGLERRDKTEELKEIGASAVVMKPYSPKDLLSAVRKALLPAVK